MFGLSLQIDKFGRGIFNPPIPVTKEVPSYHLMVVFNGMIDFVKNEDELAAVISHEFGHLELQHTQMANHNLYREYNADLISVYYMKKAGYNPCVISKLWDRMNAKMVNLRPSSHPLKLSRSFYMKFQECKNQKLLETKKLTAEDAYKVYENIAKHVEARIRFNTFFIINSQRHVNAYVTTIMRNKR